MNQEELNREGAKDAKILKEKGKIKMSMLKDRFAGKPALVLGGGPSLPGDLERWATRQFNRDPQDRQDEGAILIGVNYHAELLVEPDFMVFNDDPEGDARLMDAVRSTKAVRVSPGKWSDVEFDVDVWTGFYSSNTAAWFALWCGCDPVILCGMDCYVGERKYFHDYGHHVPVFDYPLDMHLRPWYEDGRNLLPNVRRLKAMSGPLGALFGYWKEEILQGYTG